MFTFNRIMRLLALFFFGVLLNEFIFSMQERTSDEVPMPTYFRFLALLAFKIFAAEGVNFNCTNVIDCSHCTVWGNFYLDYNFDVIFYPGRCCHFGSWFRWKI